jgi:hypothetical protein
VRVEWLILADAAQISQGKLYLLGAGWDILHVNTDFPVQQHLAVAVAFRVPWDETNQRHPVEIEIQDQDGRQLFKAGGEIEVGRPPGFPAGQDQRAQLALDVALSFEQPGGYLVVARVQDQESRVPFSVVPGPLLAARQRQTKPRQD